MFTDTRNMIPHQTLYDPENLGVLIASTKSPAATIATTSTPSTASSTTAAISTTSIYTVTAAFNLYLSSECSPKPG